MEFKLPQRFENSNKATYGRVLNIAGSDYMSGAAYLSSVAALKIGAGYCFMCSSEKAISAVAAQTQNIVFVPYSKLPQNIASADVISIGCGLGTDDNAVNIFSKFVDSSHSATPIIVDADGLNILAENNVDLKYDFMNKHFKNLVFTPHPKEAARLLGISLEEVLRDTEKAARSITEEYNCITVLKSHETIVVSPEGNLYKNTTGNNSMAKAGSGDVLTGIISGLAAQGLSQGFSLYEAACLGVYLHGKCGDIARDKFTSYCVMASDLIEMIPSAIKQEFLN